MITLKITCAMCGKALPQEIDAERQNELSLSRIEREISRYGWIMQVNGEIVDAYCSKKCAK